IRADLLLARRDKIGQEEAERRFREEIALVRRDRACVDLATLLIGRGALDEAKPLLEGVTEKGVKARALLLRSEIERRSGRSEAARRKGFEAELGRVEPKDAKGMERRRALIALARCRLIAGDAEGAGKPLYEFEGLDDPRWSGFARYPNTGP